jgi:hypothetical protein
MRMAMFCFLDGLKHSNQLHYYVTYGKRKGQFALPSTTKVSFKDEIKNLLINKKETNKSKI